MINGVLSSPWQITRGVRQGDPLLCLFFDLAIEPLAASLRKSNLKGCNIPCQVEKVIANLFADDTTTFLSQKDDMNELNPILDDWCIASGANLNSNKTEIIPIVSPEYWQIVLWERKMRPDGTRIPEGIHIAEDGSSICILVAWFGNNADQSTPWSTILEKIDKSLKAWEGSTTMEERWLNPLLCLYFLLTQLRFNSPFLLFFFSLYFYPSTTSLSFYTTFYPIFSTSSLFFLL